jgi:hypothetical protein
VAKIRAVHLGIPKSEETKKKIREAAPPLRGGGGGLQGGPTGPLALLGIKRPETLKPHAIKIEVSDLELDTKIIYNSICAAAEALNIRHSIISGYFSLQAWGSARKSNRRFAAPKGLGCARPTLFLRFPPHCVGGVRRKRYKKKYVFTKIDT